MTLASFSVHFLELILLRNLLMKSDPVFQDKKFCSFDPSSRINSKNRSSLAMMRSRNATMKVSMDRAQMERSCSSLTYKHLTSWA